MWEAVRGLEVTLNEPQEWIAVSGDVENIHLWNTQNPKYVEEKVLVLITVDWHNAITAAHLNTALNFSIKA